VSDGPPLRRTKQASKEQGAYSIQTTALLEFMLDLSCQDRFTPSPAATTATAGAAHHHRPENCSYLRNIAKLVAPRAAAATRENRQRAQPFEPPPEPDDTFGSDAITTSTPVESIAARTWSVHTGHMKLPRGFDEPRSPLLRDARLLAPGRLLPLASI